MCARMLAHAQAMARFRRTLGLELSGQQAQRVTQIEDLARLQQEVRQLAGGR